MEQPFVSNLKFHPLNDKVYGAEKLDTDLATSIEKHGLLTPLIITKKRVVISGNRRLKALQHLSEKHPGKFKQANVIVFRGSDLEAERILIESNRQRVKTAGQLTREAAELFRIETELAKQRMLATQNNRAAKAISPEQASGQARDKVANTLGIGAKKVDQAVAIVQAAKDGNKKAKEQLKKLDKNETTVNASHRVVFDKKTDDSQRFPVIRADVERLESRVETLCFKKKELQKLSDEQRRELRKRVSAVVIKLKQLQEDL